MATDHALKKHWYDRLKESGFRDIERANGRLIEEKHPRTIRRALQTKAEREAYFRIAAHFLFSFDFSCERARKLWELHADGRSLSFIAGELNMKKSTVYIWVKRFREIAGLK